MTFEDIKSAVMSLSAADQKRLIMDVVPAIWPKACTDEACVVRMKELVDEEIVKKYREEHMDGI